MYIGKTNNIKRRFLEHCSGKVQSTKSRRPLELIFTIPCKNELEAREIEKDYKKGYKREIVRKKLEEWQSGLSHLS